MDKKKIEELSHLFKHLSHPIRLCILTKLVFDGETNVTQLTSCIETSQPNLSQHLSKLRAANLVTTRKDANEVYYRVENQQVIHCIHTYLGEEN